MCSNIAPKDSPFKEVRLESLGSELVVLPSRENFTTLQFLHFFLLCKKEGKRDFVFTSEDIPLIKAFFAEKWNEEGQDEIMDFLRHTPVFVTFTFNEED